MRRLTPHLLSVVVVGTVAVGCGDDSPSPADASETDGGLTVTATEFAFEGLPDTIDAATTHISLVNEGEEVHELALFLRNEGTTQPVEELLSLPEEEVMALITPVTEAEQLTALPGATASGVIDLEAGDYIAICLVPVGLTDLEQAPPSDAPPHAAQGMVSEFTVS